MKDSHLPFLLTLSPHDSSSLDESASKSEHRASINFAKLIPLLTLLALPVVAQDLGKVNTASLSSRIQRNQKEPSIQFSWKIKSAGRGQLQAGYRILVAKDAAELKPAGKLVWDSQQVDSFQSLYVNYDGPALDAGTYHWKVQLTNNDKKAGAWSSPSSFVIPEKEEAKKPATTAIAAQSIGAFECSDDTLNKVFKKTITARKKNLTVPNGA